MPSNFLLISTPIELHSKEILISYPFKFQHWIQPCKLSLGQTLPFNSEVAFSLNQSSMVEESSVSFSALSAIPFLSSNVMLVSSRRKIEDAPLSRKWMKSVNVTSWVKLRIWGSLYANGVRKGMKRDCLALRLVERTKCCKEIVGSWFFSFFRPSFFLNWNFQFESPLVI